MTQHNDGWIIIKLDDLFDQQAKLTKLPQYEREVLSLAGQGGSIVLTGPAPVWLYLKLAHVLHGKARRLIYRSPVTGDVVIFDHDPF